MGRNVGGGPAHGAESESRAPAFEYRLLRWLDDNWAQPNGCRVYHQINVAGPGKWTENYRIPDLVLLTPDRFHIDRNEYFDGGPDAVVEIHSAEDEAYDKLDFYAGIGVREVWIIDRDTKQPEVFKLSGDTYQRREPNTNGWLSSTVTGTEVRAAAAHRMEFGLVSHPESAALLP